MADVLQVEHKVLAPTDLGVHLQVVVSHDIPAVELVPENTVVEIGRLLHHVGGVLLPGQYPVLVDVALAGDPLPHYPVKIGDDQVAVVLSRRLHQQLGGVGRDPVVAVQELKIDAPGPADANVPGIGHAGVLLVDDLDPGIRQGIRVADGAGAVLAAVVHQQQLKIRVLLAQDTVDAAANGLFRVVYGYDDADGWCHRAALLKV